MRLPPLVDPLLPTSASTAPMDRPDLPAPQDPRDPTDQQENLDVLRMAALAVLPDLLDPREHLEMTELPEALDSLVPLERCRKLPAPTDLLVLPDHQESLDPMVRLVLLETLDLTDLPESRETLELPEAPEHLANRARMELMARVVTPVAVTTVRLPEPRPAIRQRLLSIDSLTRSTIIIVATLCSFHRIDLSCTVM